MIVLVVGVLAIWIIVFAAMALIPLLVDAERDHDRAPLSLPVAGQGGASGRVMELHDQAA